MTGERIFYRARDGRQSALMEDHVHTVAGAGNSVCITQIALNEVNSIKKAGEVFFVACFKIVKATDRFSAFDKRLGNPGAYKSCAAGD